MLEHIHHPADVRALDADELDELAADVRRNVIEAVARVGGHLGSNLGAVELTISLHRSFDSPQDLLLWDTGHQAYVHKMLTGRTGQFETLRQDGGLAGYPQRVESVHDVIENSHASTALSWAYGIAEGQRFLPAGERRGVVAVVGDGALTGGMAYEALNNIGHDQTPMTIVLNDNGRSYAETVSRLSSQVSRMRMDPRYRTWRSRADHFVERIPLIHRLTGASLRGLKHAVADAPALQAFVEALGVRYLGPVNGHDVGAMDAAFASAERFDGPILVHVLTEKGKGYEPAETDPEKRLHDTSAFDPATGEATKSKQRSWTAAFSDALSDLCDEIPEIVALTAAMPGSTGLLPIAERHPDRVIDVGIAEQHAVTSAAGLAYAGRIPVVAIYSPFFPRAFDQANLDVGLHDEHVVFAFDRAGITGPDGPSAHGVLDLGLSLRIPNMTVLAPSSDLEVAALLRTAVEDVHGPVSLRFSRGACPTGDQVGTGLDARLVREGSDVVIVAVGDRLGPAVTAARTLAVDGIDAAVWDVRCVRPLDPALVAAAAAAPLVVTVENGYVAGGAGAHVADAILDHAGLASAPPVLRLGVPDAYVAHGSPDRLLADLGLDADGIAAAVGKAVTDLA
nr:1-deoxy-D-xylulose-5-phosphate synthase [Salsipaludibacter albus]